MCVLVEAGVEKQGGGTLFGEFKTEKRCGDALGLIVTCDKSALWSIYLLIAASLCSHTHSFSHSRLLTPMPEIRQLSGRDRPRSRTLPREGEREGTTGSPARPRRAVLPNLPAPKTPSPSSAYSERECSD